MRVQIVGVKKSKTKNGKECYNINALRNYSDYDQDNAECEGKDVVTAFTYKDWSIHPGDEVDFRYEPGFEGRATLAEIIMLKPAGGNPFEKKEEKK